MPSVAIPAARKSAEQLRAGGVVADDADGVARGRPARGRCGRRWPRPQEHLALGEAQDEHGRFPRDPAGLPKRYSSRIRSPTHEHVGAGKAVDVAEHAFTSFIASPAAGARLAHPVGPLAHRADPPRRGPASPETRSPVLPLALPIAREHENRAGTHRAAADEIGGFVADQGHGCLRSRSSSAAARRRSPGKGLRQSHTGRDRAARPLSDGAGRRKCRRAWRRLALSWARSMRSPRRAPPPRSSPARCPPGSSRRRPRCRRHSGGVWPPPTSAGAEGGRDG